MNLQTEVLKERDIANSRHYPVMDDQETCWQLEYHVDGVVDGWLQGWAWCPASPDLIVTIELETTAGSSVSVLAANYRADLAIVGKREGFCAFFVALSRTGEAPAKLYARWGENHRRRLADIDDPPIIGTGLFAPVQFVGQAGVTGYIDKINDELWRGWVYRQSAKEGPVELSFCEHGVELLRVDALEWRQDIGDIRRGEGLCGFELKTPRELIDGKLHLIDVIEPSSRRSLLPTPLRVQFAPLDPVELSIPGTHRYWLESWPPPRELPAAHGALDLTIIVNFYNMRREAERTLTSLTREYQQGIEELAYEVLCIDNGSDPPLEREWIEGFGDEFRLIRPAHPEPSPCSAINAAAAQARGRHVAIMIDGAHVLSPGVFQEAMAALRGKEADVVGVRHWFVGGDQRWLAASGYTREQEDRLFERIHWPRRGYELFRISAPMEERREPWFTALLESNCLFMTTELYCRIGGIEERFVSPGAGFANLDLLERAATASDRPITCLVGEASFHQFHGGTTTNVSDFEKDSKVRHFLNECLALRGKDCQPVEFDRIRLRGSIRTIHMVGVSQRPLLPLSMDVTSAMRSVSLVQHVPPGLREHLQSVYVECGLHQEVRWRGLKTGVAPADLLALQDIVWRVKPDRIVVSNVSEGLLAYLADILDNHQLPDSRIVVVNGAAAARVTSGRIMHVDRRDGELVHSSSRNGLEHVESSLAILVPAEHDTYPLAALNTLADTVSDRSYLICVGTVFGQPWLGYSSRWYREAIKEFLIHHKEFVIDHQWDRQLVSVCVGGYLHKIEHTDGAVTYDASLDELDTFV